MLGYETNYAKDNQAFSRAYLFNFLPFYHSGLRLTLPVNDKVSLLYMLTNGIQQTEEFNDFKSNHFAAIVKPTSMVTWTINYYFGQEQPDGGEPGGPDGFFRVFDTYVTVTPTPALTLGVDVNYVTNEVEQVDDPSLSLQGLGAYARVSVHESGGTRHPLRAAGRRGIVWRDRSGAARDDADRRIQAGRRLPRCAASSAATGRTSRSSRPPGAVDLRGDQNTALLGGLVGDSATRRVPGRTESTMLLAWEWWFSGSLTFAAMIGVHRAVRSRVGEVMTLLSLLLSVAAFVYLVYAMLRPEKF